MTVRSAQARASGAGIALAVLGWSLIIAGAGLAVWGFSLDATVQTAAAIPGFYDSASGQILGSQPAERVNNTGLLNDKLMLVIAGGALLVSGSIFAARKP